METTVFLPGTTSGGHNGLRCMMEFLSGVREDDLHWSQTSNDPSLLSIAAPCSHLSSPANTANLNKETFFGTELRKHEK